MSLSSVPNGIESIRRLLEREFSDECEDDVALLRRLWIACHQEILYSSESGGHERIAEVKRAHVIPDFERVGSAWTGFGFQRDDPVSDLRGGGVLALRNLVYFLERQPVYAMRMLESRRPADSGFDPEQPGFYPFAAAGINVTRTLARIGGVFMDSKVKTDASSQRDSSFSAASFSSSSSSALLFSRLMTSEDDKMNNGFDECYCVCFRLVDRLFDEKNASYMGFNSILKEAEEIMRNAMHRALAFMNDPKTSSIVYMPQRVDPREPCSQDHLTRELKMAPPGWGTQRANLASVNISGVLDKLPVSSRIFTGSRKIAQWRTRFFVVHGDIVAWFKPVSTDWSKSQLHGTLTNYIRITANSIVRPHKFDTCSLKLDKCQAPDGRRGKLRLRAANIQQARRWIKVLEHAIDSLAAGVSSSQGALNDPKPAHDAKASEDFVDLDELHDRLSQMDITAADHHEENLSDASSTLVDAIPTQPDFHGRSLRTSSDPEPRSRFRFRRPSNANKKISSQARLGSAFGNTMRGNRRSSAPAAPPLQRNARSTAWISCTDDNNQVYYVHRESGHTQWNLPPGWTSSTSGWAARLDKASGHTYYFFASTGEVTWVLPDR